MSLFSDAPHLTTGSTLPIEGGYYGVLPYHHGLCSSGRTTGQVCRSVVENTDACTRFDVNGVLSISVPRYATSHLGDGDGGWDHGDSGGPVHYAVNGKMTIAGIVSGRNTNYIGADSYYIAQLSGVRIWGPALTVSG